MFEPPFKFNEFVLKDRERLQIPGLIKELQLSIQNRRTFFKSAAASISRSY